jgi:hypothetical protein
MSMCMIYSINTHTVVYFPSSAENMNRHLPDASVVTSLSLEVAGACQRLKAVKTLEITVDLASKLNRQQ